MYIVTNTNGKKKKTADDIEELSFELELIRARNKKLNIDEDYKIYKVDEHGEILEEFNINIPNDDIESVLNIKNNDYEEEIIAPKTTSMKQSHELNNLSDDEMATYKKMLEKENTSHKEVKKEDEERRKIREMIENNSRREEIQLKEAKETPINPFIDRSEKSIVFQTPVVEEPKPIVYETTTIISADELKLNLIKQVDAEANKLEHQIFKLEKQLLEYKKLKKNLLDTN